MNGFLLINKPKGITSFDVIRKVRKVLNMRKIGHAGTLDPMATGLLLLALGEGTKLLEYLIKKDKTYLAEVRFGAVSTTFDAEGEITETGTEGKTDTVSVFEAVQQKFLGNIEQVPPKYSALKINGEKAYDLARRGEEVKLNARQVKIYRNEISNYQYPNLKLEIDCSTGTYIRSIANDLGEELGCGGYLTALQRTKIGKFDLENAIELEDVSAEKVLPIEWGAKDFIQVEITEKEHNKILQGQQITLKYSLNNKTIVACFFQKRLVSICQYDKERGRLQPVKNFVAS